MGTTGCSSGAEALSIDYAFYSSAACRFGVKLSI